MHQAVVLGELGQGARCAAPTQVLGRGHQQLRRFGQSLRDVARVLELKRDAHRQVEALSHPVRVAGVERAHHLAVRMAFGEGRYQRHHVVGAEGRRRADAHHATGRPEFDSFQLNSLDSGAVCPCRSMG